MRIQTLLNLTGFENDCLEVKTYSWQHWLWSSLFSFQNGTRGYLSFLLLKTSSAVKCLSSESLAYSIHIWKISKVRKLQVFCLSIYQNCHHLDSMEFLNAQRVECNSFLFIFLSFTCLLCPPPIFPRFWNMRWFVYYKRSFYKMLHCCMKCIVCCWNT